MTEKQGGSDVRANTTRAVPIGNLKGIGADYYLTGHKWFCSAPMCDIFLTLAQTDKGLSCFLVCTRLKELGHILFECECTNVVPLAFLLSFSFLPFLIRLWHRK